MIMPPVQEEIFNQLKELEVHGMCLPRELGGLACPLLVMQISNELMARADVSVCAHNGFHGGIAMAMLAYSIHEGSTEFDVERGRISRTRFQEAIEEIAPVRPGKHGHHRTRRRLRQEPSVAAVCNPKTVPGA